MSLIKRLIGQKKRKPTKQDQTKKVNNAIQQLREQVTLLNKRKVHSEKQIANYNKKAQECLKNKNRKGALAKIKLRKQVEKRIESLDNQIFNLEVQIMALDESIMNRNMLDAMTSARNAMHVENPDAMIEKAEQVQEDIQEALDLQQEFNDLLGQPLVDYDEDELDAELAQLDDEVMDDGLLYGNIGKKNINKYNIKMEEKEDIDQQVEKEVIVDEDEEIAQIKQLEMEMNMTGNDDSYNNKHIVDVQVVQTSSKQMLMAC